MEQETKKLWLEATCFAASIKDSLARCKHVNTIEYRDIFIASLCAERLEKIVSDLFKIETDRDFNSNI